MFASLQTLARRCYTRNRRNGLIAGVAELADARDSKSRALHWACGFDPHLQHHNVVKSLGRSCTISWAILGCYNLAQV